MSDYQPDVGELRDLNIRLVQADQRAEKAEAFKAYVHRRLDDAGVPRDPEPEKNAATGCRIEGRLNHLFKTNEALELMIATMVSAADNMLRGGDQGPAETCEDCGLGGVGELRDVLNQARPIAERVRVRLNAALNQPSTGLICCPLCNQWDAMLADTEDWQHPICAACYSIIEPELEKLKGQKFVKISGSSELPVAVDLRSGVGPWTRVGLRLGVEDFERRAGEARGTPAPPTGADAALAAARDFQFGTHLDDTEGAALRAGGISKEYLYQHTRELVPEQQVRERIERLIDQAVEAVKTTPNYPDTKVGMRQQWVRDQAIARIEALRARIEALRGPAK